MFLSRNGSALKRQRPFRSDGGCCEKGVASSGEKTVSTALPSPGIVPSH